MPQFDSVTFFNQLFWFTFIFMFFYFFVLGYLIPSISVVLKVRNKKLKLDSGSSSAMKAESSLVLNSYDQKFIDLSTVLIGAVSNFSTGVLVLKNTPNKKIQPFYVHSLVQLFLKLRLLK